ncbi:MAG: hypothetical protein ABIG39_03110 [Candidatus Micrarchaeota archaeon]
MRNTVLALLALMLLIGASFAGNGNGKGNEDVAAGYAVASNALERYEHAKERYIESMDKWREKRAGDKESVFARGKTYTSNAVSMLQRMLDVVSSQVSKSKGLSEEQRNGYMAEISGHQETLALLSLSVENVTTARELAEQTKLVKKEWNETRKNARIMLGGMGIKGIDNAIELGLKAENRTRNLIGGCEEAGFDISGATEHLEGFGEQLMLAQEENDLAIGMFDAGNAAEGYEHLRNAHRHIVESKKFVNGLKQDLRNCVAGKGRFVLRGEGWLRAIGSGRAEITGNGSVEASFGSDSNSGKVTIIDRAGDVVVNIEGGHEVKRQDDATIAGLKSVNVLVYTGAGDINVSGSRFTVILNSNDVELYAEGRGIAILRGNGTYEAGSLGNQSVSTSSGAWTGKGAAVSIAANTE